MRKLLGDTASPESLSAAFDRNLPFAPKDHIHNSFHTGWNIANPILYTAIFELAQAGQKDGESAELADWVVENISLPGDVKGEIIDVANRPRP